jgi:cytochrome subunit of sulfide dehydrogenase
MKKVILLAVALVSPATQAQDTAARNLTASCAICHGTDGRPVTKDVVVLAGRSSADMATQLRAFRDGQRPSTVMHQIAKGYTDQQIDAMAAWFASQKR